MADFSQDPLTTRLPILENNTYQFNPKTDLSADYMNTFYGPLGRTVGMYDILPMTPSDSSSLQATLDSQLQTLSKVQSYSDFLEESVIKRCREESGIEIPESAVIHSGNRDSVLRLDTIAQEIRAIAESEAGLREKVINTLIPLVGEAYELIAGCPWDKQTRIIADTERELLRFEELGVKV